MLLVVVYLVYSTVMCVLLVAVYLVYSTVMCVTCSSVLGLLYSHLLHKICFLPGTLSFPPEINQRATLLRSHSLRPSPESLV